jgi:hypothetical protein
MIKGKNALKKEEEEDILKKPRSVKVQTLESILTTYGGRLYGKMSLDQLKEGCKGIILARLKKDDQDTTDLIASIYTHKTAESLLSWVTEEMFK